MRFRLRTLLIVIALGPPVLGTIFTWDRMNTSNCGGNNAALTDVCCYVDLMQVAAGESSNGEFLVTSATATQRKQLAQIAHDAWLGDGQFLVSTLPYRLNPYEPRRIVIVCNRPFTNVPRYVFGEAPPAYAAAFSDGSTSLLTANDFAALDRSSLVSLNEIIDQSD